jgi:peptidyl-dipeptidase A
MSPRRLVTLALVPAFLPLAALRAQQHAAPPTLAQARAFMTRAEAELTDLGTKLSRVQWVADNFITEDTELLSADASEANSAAVRRLALEARKFDRATMPADLRRKFTLLRLALVAPPPGDKREAEELARLGAALPAEYGRGKYCRPAQPGSDAAKRGDRDECLAINEVTKILATNRDPAELRDVWAGWHAVGAPMKTRYARFVELSNRGARELGFRDVGEMWRSGYDMAPEQFSAELERLWGQLRPFYQSLHAFVRAKLVEKYGPQVVPPDGPIPAHLLGNPWAQEWGNVYEIVAPAGAAGPGFDLTDLLVAKNTQPLDLFRIGERFYTSLGLPQLPRTFWERSLFTRPRDRDVVCHASAWVIDLKEDVRIKMCAEVTGEDLVTVHHEQGHDYYFLAYKDQPYFFQNGAHDGFHEAIGDAVALSITPEYLRTIGLLDRVPSPAADTMLLLRQALDKVAFLPFGLVIDQWRWKVFSGEIPPERYNTTWWRLRREYQGVAPPMPRGEDQFDPGAKYHVPANVPYTRYFLARVLQFQFYRAMCRAAGFTGPLHSCSFYGSRAAGDRLWRMMQLGASRPWPDALEAMTGERRMDAGAMLEYFAPLSSWLDSRTRGRSVGWK